MAERERRSTKRPSAQRSGSVNTVGWLLLINMCFVVVPGLLFHVAANLNTLEAM